MDSPYQQVIKNPKGKNKQYNTRKAAAEFVNTKEFNACECVVKAMTSEPKELKKLTKDCTILTLTPFYEDEEKSYCLQFRFSDGSGDFNAVSVVTIDESES